MNMKTYKIQGMDCTSCAMMIESDLEDVGIKAKCNYAKETLEVEGANINEKVINDVVEKAGYKII